PRRLRKTSSSGVSPSALTLTAPPFTVKLVPCIALLASLTATIASRRQGTGEVMSSSFASGEGAQLSGGLFRQSLHQRRGIAVLRHRRRLPSGQRRPIAMSRGSERLGQALLRRNRQRLQPGSAQIIDQLG